MLIGILLNYARVHKKSEFLQIGCRKHSSKNVVIMRVGKGLRSCQKHDIVISTFTNCYCRCCCCYWLMLLAVVVVVAVVEVVA